jgi:hypothetical protein
METYYSTLREQPKPKQNKLPSIKIMSKSKWYIRLYYTITNPFTYLFKGIVRY